jgi:gamma-glutamyl-gamma-aminobutyrate hydrolase PuuD
LAKVLDIMASIGVRWHPEQQNQRVAGLLSMIAIAYSARLGLTD